MGILFYVVATLKPYFPANKSLTKWCEVICDALHDFVPFAQFKKREKHPWRSVTFSKFAGQKPLLKNFTKSNTPQWVFFTFFKLLKWYQIAQRITFFFYIISIASSNTLIIITFSSTLANLECKHIKHFTHLQALYTPSDFVSKFFFSIYPFHDFFNIF